MRISDWSSDVCSSDLSFDIGTGPLEPDPYIMETGKVDLGVYYTKDRFEAEKEIFGRVWLNVAEAAEIPNPGDWVVRDVAVRSASVVIVRGKDNQVRAFHNICRSEEHTSELQSLMRISYAVFCLKKKKIQSNK